MLTDDGLAQAVGLTGLIPVIGNYLQAGVASHVIRFDTVSLFAFFGVTQAPIVERSFLIRTNKAK